MQPMISAEMRQFLTPTINEEAVDQPLYHIQSYGTGGSTQLTFFQTAAGSATNGLSDTNMDNAGSLSAGKKFGIFSIGISIYGTVPAAINSTSTALAVNDIQKILEGIANFQFTVLNKNYLTLAPLAALPAGFGVNLGGQAITASSNASFVTYANNGAPFATARYQLRVPIPIPPQVTFSAIMNFNSAITIGTASRIAVHLWGIQIRAKQ